MLMADTFAIFFAVLGAILGHVAFWLLCRGIFPTTSKMAGEAVARGIVLPLVVGVPMTLGAAVVIVVVSTVLGGVGQALGVAATCLFIAYAHVGLSGVVGTIGARLGGAAESPWREVVRGGAALSFAWVLPFLGWFGLLPLSLVLGAGAATIALFRRVTAAEPKAVPARAAEQTMVSSFAPVSPWR